MRYRYLIALLVLGYAAVAVGWAQEAPESGSPPAIHFAQRAESNGITTVVPSEDPYAAVVEGDLGCLDGSHECEPGLRVTARRNQYSMGEPLSAILLGSGSANIKVFRNYELVDSLQTDLPMELPLQQFAGAGDLLTVEVATAAGSVSRSLRVGAAAGQVNAASSTVAFTFYAYIPAGYYPNRSIGGLYRVTTARLAGGFKRYSKPTCAMTVPRGAVCPSYLVVVGDTDRIARGESVLTKITGKGVASRVGVMISGVVRGEFTNVPLPIMVGGTNVSTKATDDAITVFATLNGRTTEKRLALGSRPASVTQAR